jgi:hypothetical protein
VDRSGAVGTSPELDVCSEFRGFLDRTGPDGGRQAMRLDRLLARAFRMDDATWARHANPWSVWTRFTVLPLVVLAIWSRVWLGWWSLAAVAPALAWTWLNPRLFPPPRSTDSWASRATLGERVWLARREVPIPPHHRVLPTLLSAVAAMGLVPLAWGLAALEPWPTLLGMAVIFLGKLWFADRMVWLYQDMKDADPAYASWLRR